MRWQAGFLAVLSFAQTGHGVITGKAFDADHHAVSGAKVYLESVGGRSTLVTQTDQAGVFRFEVAAGSYTLHLGTDKSSEPIRVAAGEVYKRDLEPRPAAFFDEPKFTVAGVTDNTYRGGHGADTILRSSEKLAKATASLSTGLDTEVTKNEQSGHPLEAVKELQAAAEKNPSEQNLFNWGTELLNHRAPQAAAEVFTKGERLYPSSVRMLLGLAVSNYAQGVYQKAAECFFKATDLQPKDPQPYLFLAQTETPEINRLPEYLQRMERFATIQPENAKANYYLAMGLWREDAGDHDPRTVTREHKLLAKAVTVDPHFGEAYLQDGIVYAFEQQYGAAIQAYRQAIAQNPNLAEAHYRLSEAYRATGDLDSSRLELTTYRNLTDEAEKKLEKERRAVQQFVVALRNTDKPN